MPYPLMFVQFMFTSMRYQEGDMVPKRGHGEKTLECQLGMETELVMADDKLRTIQHGKNTHAQLSRPRRVQQDNTGTITPSTQGERGTRRHDHTNTTRDDMMHGTARVRCGQVWGWWTKQHDNTTAPTRRGTTRCVARRGYDVGRCGKSDEPESPCRCR